MALNERLFSHLFRLFFNEMMWRSIVVLERIITSWQSGSPNHTNINKSFSLALAPLIAVVGRLLYNGCRKSFLIVIF